MTNLAYEIKNDELDSKRKKALAVKKKNEKALKRKLMRRLTCIICDYFLCVFLYKR